MAEFLRFIGRNAGASLIGAAGIVLNGIGYAEQAGAIVTHYEPWQLQATGAALFVVFVLMVLFKYDKAHHARSSSVVAAPTTPTAKPRDEPEKGNEVAAAVPPPGNEHDAAPLEVAEQFIALMQGNPTNLQKSEFLSRHVGKWFYLELSLMAIDPEKSAIRTLLAVENGATIFVYFDPKWKDRLVPMKRRDRLRFKAQVGEEKYDFVNGALLS